jgi:hypothetical protein
MTNPSSAHNKILALEMNLLRSPFRYDHMFLERVLAKDFTEFGKSGRVYDKIDTIAALIDENQNEAQISTELEMRSVKFTDLGLDAVLLTYTLKPSTDDAAEISSLRSSIWKRYGEEWKLVFHQGTPAATS